MTILSERVPKLFVIIGGGGHARALQEVLESLGIGLHGFLAPSAHTSLIDVPWLGADDGLERLDTTTTLLVNGIGSTSDTDRRRDVFSAARQLGFTFPAVVDRSALVRPSVHVGAGAQILAGAIVNSDAEVGENCIVNSGAVIEHGVVVGDHTHVSSNAAIGGNVKVGIGVHIGIGASVIQGISIGSKSTVGAGAVVIRDVGEDELAVGVPARSVPKGAGTMKGGRANH